MLRLGHTCKKVLKYFSLGKIAPSYLVEPWAENTITQNILPKTKVSEN